MGLKIQKNERLLQPNGKSVRVNFLFLSTLPWAMLEWWKPEPLGEPGSQHKSDLMFKACSWRQSREMNACSYSLGRFPYRLNLLTKSRSAALTTMLCGLFIITQVALAVKNLPVNTGDIKDAGSIPGYGRSPGGGHGNAFQYFCLENPTVRGAWWATVHIAAKSQTRLKQLRFSK